MGPGAQSALSNAYPFPCTCEKNTLELSVATCTPPAPAAAAIVAACAQVTWVSPILAESSTISRVHFPSTKTTWLSAAPRDTCGSTRGAARLSVGMRLSPPHQRRTGASEAAGSSAIVVPVVSYFLFAEEILIGQCSIQPLLCKVKSTLCYEYQAARVGRGEGGNG